MLRADLRVVELKFDHLNVAPHSAYLGYKLEAVLF